MKPPNTNETYRVRGDEPTSTTRHATFSSASSNTPVGRTASKQHGSLSTVDTARAKRCAGGRCRVIVRQQIAKSPRPARAEARRNRFPEIKSGVMTRLYSGGNTFLHSNRDINDAVIVKIYTRTDREPPKFIECLEFKLSLSRSSRPRGRIDVLVTEKLYGIHTRSEINGAQLK